MMNLFFILTFVLGEAHMDCNADIRHDSFGNADKPGICYLLNGKDGGTFSQARSFCQGLNNSVKWDVADIEDQEENEFINQVVNDKNLNGIAFWIGLNLGTDGKWKYLNGSNSTGTVYENWDFGMPETRGGVDQDCVVFYEVDGTFQDKACYIDNNKYLCTVKLSEPNVSCSRDAHIDSFGNPDKPGVCYLKEDTLGHFDQARSFCKGLSDTLGWDVADIQDEQEKNFFMRSKGNNFWIGLNDRATEGKWQYLNGIHDIDNVYLNWKNGQPNGEEINCVIYGKNGAFQNVACGTKSYGYMCKARITPDDYPHSLHTSSEITERNGLECPTTTPLAYHGCTTFMFLSGAAGCNDSTAIHRSFAPDVTRCARMCLYLYPGVCRSFSFLATGGKDACELCADRITEEVALPMHANRVYYYIE